MSPSTLRRYRAERLLRDEFERLRCSVIANVSRRLRAAGVRLDASDIDAAYAQAWQGLYTAMLEGQEILNPAGWLALVSYRRALDEHRARSRVQWSSVPGERDIATELDDRTKLRQLFEALRTRLTAREQRAATLCYLQGLSRAEAAARMGVSETRMRKLMEGRGPGSPGVAGKVGALLDTIRAGEWCEEQGSLMRGLAYGILDPAGERYRLALLHRDTCPACRAYVLSLRGLAAVLPPLPWLGLAAGAGAATGTGAGAVATTGVGGGALSSSSVAGAGAAGAGAAGAAGVAGGGWWLAGPLGAKLAVGCVLALGVGAGCVALDQGSRRDHAPSHRRDRARPALARRSVSGQHASGTAMSAARAGAGGSSSARASGAAPAGRAAIAGAAQASREFGPEQPTAASAARSGAAAGSSPPTASAASAGRTAPSPAESTAREPAAEGSSAGASAGAVSAAEREFAPG